MHTSSGSQIVGGASTDLMKPMTDLKG